jgi:hypothetical protein
MGSPPFGFGATLTDEGDPELEVWYFKNGTDLFQSETLTVDLVEFGLYFPILR